MLWLVGLLFWSVGYLDLRFSSLSLSHVIESNGNRLSCWWKSPLMLLENRSNDMAVTCIFLENDEFSMNKKPFSKLVDEHPYSLMKRKLWPLLVTGGIKGSLSLSFFSFSQNSTNNFVSIWDPLILLKLKFFCWKYYR